MEKSNASYNTSMNNTHFSGFLARLTGLAGHARGVVATLVLLAAFGFGIGVRAADAPPGGRGASPGEPMPYSDRWSQQVVAITSYPDGAMDQVLVGTGRGNVLGSYTVRTTARLTPIGVDFAAHTALFVVAGETRSTSIDGSVLTTQFSGRFTVPLDVQFSPAPGPRPFSVRWSVTGGTGRYAGVIGNGMFTGTGTPEGRFDGMSWGTVWTKAGSALIRPPQKYGAPTP